MARPTTAQQCTGARGAGARVKQTWKWEVVQHKLTSCHGTQPSCSAGAHLCGILRQGREGQPASLGNRTPPCRPCAPKPSPAHSAHSPAPTAARGTQFLDAGAATSPAGVGVATAGAPGPPSHSCQLRLAAQPSMAERSGERSPIATCRGGQSRPGGGTGYNCTASGSRASRRLELIAMLSALLLHTTAAHDTARGP